MATQNVDNAGAVLGGRDVSPQMCVRAFPFSMLYRLSEEMVASWVKEKQQ